MLGGAGTFIIQWPVETRQHQKSWRAWIPFKSIERSNWTEILKRIPPHAQGTSSRKSVGWRFHHTFKDHTRPSTFSNQIRSKSCFWRPRLSLKRFRNQYERHMFLLSESRFDKRRSRCLFCKRTGLFRHRREAGPIVIIFSWSYGFKVWITIWFQIYGN